MVCRVENNITNFSPHTKNKGKEKINTSLLCTIKKLEWKMHPYEIKTKKFHKLRFHTRMSMKQVGIFLKKVEYINMLSAANPPLKYQSHKTINKPAVLVTLNCKAETPRHRRAHC
jgi:hypothetical protein